jgi:hypothetical protein
MPSKIYKLVWKAMHERQLIAFSYSGLPRTACPVILGYGPDEKESVFTYQIAGRTSGNEKLPKWKCFRLEKLQQLRIQHGTWLEGASHEQAQSCIRYVDIDVNIPDTLAHTTPLSFGSPKLRPPRTKA